MRHVAASHDTSCNRTTTNGPMRNIAPTNNTSWQARGHIEPPCGTSRRHTRNIVAAHCASWRHTTRRGAARHLVAPHDTPCSSTTLQNCRFGLVCKIVDQSFTIFWQRQFSWKMISLATNGKVEVWKQQAPKVSRQIINCRLWLASNKLPTKFLTPDQTQASSRQTQG